MHASLLLALVGAIVSDERWLEHSGIAPAGDVDADGVADLLVASRADWMAEPRVWVLSGRDGSLIHELRAPDGARAFGCNVAGAGDVNGDGHADVLIGAGGAGRAFVHSGKDGALLFELCGLELDNAFGSAVAGGLDLDGDGGPDVVVGDPEHGQVVAFSGLRGGRLFVIDERERRERELEEDDGWGWADDWRGFGRALALIRDIDGDRCAEILVAGGGSGELALHSGRDGRRMRGMHGEHMTAVADAGDLDGDGTSDSVASVLSAGLCAWSGRSGEPLPHVEPARGEITGTSIAAVGDLDGDGASELAVGSNAAWGSFRGLAQLHSGRTGELLTSLPCSDDATDVCALGDVNDDDVPDLALCLRQAQLVRYVSGASFEVLREIDLLPLCSAKERELPALDTANIANLDPIPSGWSPSARLVPAGDVDGDGVPDLLLANRWREPWRGTSSPSVVWVLSGRNGAMVHELKPARICVRFGNALHAAGDIDGDGHADVIVAADDHPYDVRESDGSLGMRRGVVFVISGIDGRVLHRLVPPEREGHFGASVAGGADLDGDGVPDVVVAAPWYERGAVHVFSGADGTLVRTLRRDGDPGDMPHLARFGQAVLVVDDVDGDGLPELAASITPDTFRLFSVRSGVALGTRYAHLHAPRRDRPPGSALSFRATWCAPGDLDGHVDYVLAPEHGGPVRALSGATDAELFTVTPSTRR